MCLGMFPQTTFILKGLTTNFTAVTHRRRHLGDSLNLLCLRWQTLGVLVLVDA